MARTACSRFHHAVELIGGRWTGPILHAVIAGRHRYAEIRDSTFGLSDTMLSQRLRELEAEGVLERRVLPTSPVHVEYHLTEKGRALRPVLETIARWADEWVTVPSTSTPSRPGGRGMGWGGSFSSSCEE